MSCESVFFFFKQKTAYEMRISDWSSDVCSSDLLHAKLLRDVLKRLDMASADREEGAFNAARRQFYRVRLRIGDNRELRRLFPSVGMHIIHVQYSMPELQQVRRRDSADMAIGTGACRVGVCHYV